jgi:hypothetical protein
MADDNLSLEIFRRSSLPGRVADGRRANQEYERKRGPDAEASGGRVICLQSRNRGPWDRICLGRACDRLPRQEWFPAPGANSSCI